MISMYKHKSCLQHNSETPISTKPEKYTKSFTQMKKTRRNRGNRKKVRSKNTWKWEVVASDQVKRVTKGGKQMSFRLSVVVGNQKGGVGIGVGKGNDQLSARRKAVRHGFNEMVKVPLTSDFSIPHEVRGKFGTAEVLLRPSPLGEGIKAGNLARTILNISGAKDVMAKQIGSVLQMHNARAVISALANLKIIKT